MSNEEQPKIVKRDFSFYQSLRRSNPHRYYSAKVQAAMVEDANQQGNSFFDRPNGEDLFLNWGTDEQSS